MNNLKPIAQGSTHTFTVDAAHAGSRLDSYVVSQFPGYTRSFLKKIINEGWVKLNKQCTIKAGTVVKEGDNVTVNFPSLAPTTPLSSDDNLGIELVFEHSHFLILNKPAGILVHKPNHYSTEPTVVDWVTTHYQEVSDVGLIDRPGIVHRLDKETSGLLIIPRTNYAHALFGQMFRDRLIHKTYLAIVQGAPDREGTIDYAIGRHPHMRTKMHHFDKELLERNDQTKLRSALTHFKVLEYYENETTQMVAALVQAKPVTGRTHQIRVHLTALGHPLIGDTVYGSSSKDIARHALHAHALQFTFDNEPFSFEIPLPADMQQLVAKLALKN